MHATVLRKSDFYIILFAHQSLHVNAVILSVHFSISEVMCNNVRG